MSLIPLQGISTTNKSIRLSGTFGLKLSDDDYEKMLASTAEELPLKKVATAEEIAEVLVWFLEGASLITGETLIVDSGLHLGPFPPYASGKKIE